MKDIDFDELDRAVNSLMSSVPKDKPMRKVDDTDLVISEDTTEAPLEEPQIVSLEADSNPSQNLDIQPVIAPIPDSEQPMEVKQEETQPPATITRPVPSRGRFMDVVRPNRDMRNAPSLMSRQGVTLHPSSSRPTIAAAPFESSVPQPPEPEIDLAAQSAVMQELEDTAGAAGTSNLPAFSPPVLDLSENSMGEADDNAPLSSPFLPDAKVEKRPLGRPTDTNPLVDLSSELAEITDQLVPDTTQSIEEPTISPNVDAQRPEDPLPAELDSALLTIETGADTPHKATEFPQNIAPEVETPSEPANTETVSPSIETSRAMAAASIPQQYKLEAAHSDEVPTSAIYDTQPLAHPAKSKSGWLWIVAILAILVLGAAGGAAVYYLGLL